MNHGTIIKCMLTSATLFACETGLAATVINPSSLPVIIDTPGAYVLQTDIIVSDPNLSAIIIKTGGVTLDLGGHTIRGPITCSVDGNDIVTSCTGTNKAGIDIGDVYSSPFELTDPTSVVRVSNGLITGMGLAGIVAETRGSVFIDNIHASGNGHFGISLRRGAVVNSSAIGNGAVGISVNYGSIRNSIAQNNGLYGVQTQVGQISGVVAWNNRSGIESESGQILDTSSFNNKGSSVSGYGVESFEESMLSRVHARGNSNSGIVSGGLIQHSHASSNGGYGYELSSWTCYTDIAAAYNTSGPATSPTWLGSYCNVRTPVSVISESE